MCIMLICFSNSSVEFTAATEPAADCLLLEPPSSLHMPANALATANFLPRNSSLQTQPLTTQIMALPACAVTPYLFFYYFQHCWFYDMCFDCTVLYCRCQHIFKRHSNSIDVDKQVRQVSCAASSLASCTMSPQTVCLINGCYAEQRQRDPPES